jgi:hypothetical protein
MSSSIFLEPLRHFRGTQFENHWYNTQGHHYYTTDWAQYDVAYRKWKEAANITLPKVIIQPAEYRLISHMAIDHQKRSWQSTIPVWSCEVMVHTASYRLLLVLAEWSKVIWGSGCIAEDAVEFVRPPPAVLSHFTLKRIPRLDITILSLCPCVCLS